MNTREQKELYLLSARGNSAFSKRSAGMELVAELHRERSIHHAFLEDCVAGLALLYCRRNNIQAKVAENYGRTLQDISDMPNREITIVYLTDKDNGELTSMAVRAKSEGLQVETRTRTKH